MKTLKEFLNEGDVLKFTGKHNKSRDIKDDDLHNAWAMHVQAKKDDKISYHNNDAYLHHSDGSYTHVINGNLPILHKDDNGKIQFLDKPDADVRSLPRRKMSSPIHKLITRK